MWVGRPRRLDIYIVKFYRSSSCVYPDCTPPNMNFCFDAITDYYIKPHRYQILYLEEMGSTSAA